MARVNEGSRSFTFHPRVYPRMEWAILPLVPGRKASPHFLFQHSFPVRQTGRRLSLTRGAYSTRLTRGQHATRPAQTTFPPEY